MSTHIEAGRLLGRRVVAANNKSVGRLEEFRAEQRGGDLVITEYVLGVGGLLERLHLGVRLVLGQKRAGYVASWDQLDISDPAKPRLLCPVEDLRRL
jgi:hypothetical protein